MVDRGLDGVGDDKEPEAIMIEEKEKHKRRAQEDQRTEKELEDRCKKT